MGQEPVQLLLAAAHRQVEHLGSEDDPRAGPCETQVAREHHPVVIGIGRLFATQFDGQQRDTPPYQPAGQTVQQHPESEVAKGSERRRIFRLRQRDLRQAFAAKQLAAEAFEGQPEEIQRHTKRSIECRLGHGRAADEGETAGTHTPRIHAEKLIVELPRQASPEFAEVSYFDTRFAIGQVNSAEPKLAQQLFG